MLVVVILTLGLLTLAGNVGPRQARSNSLTKLVPALQFSVNQFVVGRGP